MIVIVFNQVIELLLHRVQGGVGYPPSWGPSCFESWGNTVSMHTYNSFETYLLGHTAVCVNVDFSHLPFNPKEFLKNQNSSCFQKECWSIAFIHMVLHYWSGLRSEWLRPQKGSLCLWRKLITYSVSVSLEWRFLALCWFLLWTSFLFWIAL